MLDADDANAEALRGFVQSLRVLVEEVGDFHPAFEAVRRVAAEIGVAA